MRKQLWTIVLLCLLLTGCGMVDLNEYFVTLTPTPGVNDLDSFTPVYTYTEPIPTFTPTPEIPTPTPIVIYITQEAYEVLEEGDWIIECIDPNGCLIRNEPSFLGDSEAVSEGTITHAVSRYTCVGHESCEVEVPVWWYLDDGRWASAIVWKEQ